jgi:hypothetical protein
MPTTTLDHRESGFSCPPPFYFFIFSSLSEEQKLNAENCRTSSESTWIFLDLPKFVEVMSDCHMPVTQAADPDTTDRNCSPFR